jgi:hypothetical protein
VLRFLLLAVLGVSGTDLCAQTTEADHTVTRAGTVGGVAPWAKPARSPKEAPGYVGGGRLFGGHGGVAGVPGPLDRTFGYDYVGDDLYPQRVFLGYSERPGGRPGGTYWTDRPRVFDVFSIRPVRKALAEKRGHAAMKD